MSKQKKLVLDVSAMEESFFEDCSLSGIKFMVEPYYCAWWLNKCLGTNFILNKQFGMDANELNFGMYEYVDTKNGVEHFLYTNKNEGAIKLRSLRGFNFLWLIRTAHDNLYLYKADAIGKIKAKSPNILLQDIDIENFEDRAYLIH
jgi:hypothetical protein